ncbi:MAG: ABC transporter substrate-binding protein [Coriobacteriia bacterium]|nr:ABC transporter substrate-binding protein [Coriobacteriia bacterium]
MKRTIRLTLVLALAAALALAGCSSDEPAEAPSEQPGEPAVTPAKITIGTLATQDSLPLWVAEEKEYFAEAGLPEVEIVTFQSAQESQTAFVSGAVDALMTDLIVSANLHASGTPVIVPTVMLGATTAQGRFAIVAAPGSDVTSMTDLAGVPVGTASATITEYVLDMLMAEAGVAAADVVKEEVQKMPIRFQLLMSGQLAAASLPEPFVTLAELEGATVVPGGDDTKAASNISQSVLCVNKAFADTAEGDAAVAALLEAWNAAVTDINADPDAFRTTLVSKARLPEPLAETYNVSDYPLAAPPAATDVQKVLDWMDEKGYLQAPVTPADILP